MLQYMIILLDDTSTSFCHYDVNTAKKRLINLDDLRAGIRMAMIENMTIQFVYPNYNLPKEYKDVIKWAELAHNELHQEEIIIHGICIGASTALYASYF